MPSSIHDSDTCTTDTDTGNSCYIHIDEDEDKKNLPIENLIPFQQDLGKDNALNAIIKFHYLDGEGHSSLTRELLKQASLFSVAILGVIFYYVPAKAYAESICADPAYKDIPCDFFLINHVAGTMLVAGGVLMSATNTFFDRQMAESIPEKLQSYLKYPFTRRQKLAENAVTYMGSFVASIPFVIITVVNPIPGLPKSIVLSQAFMVGLTNTLLHLLPFKLALKNPLYRFPFLPFEFIIKAIAKAQLSEEQKQEKALQQSLDVSIQEIKQRIISALTLAQKRLSIYGLNASGCGGNHDVARYIQENQASTELPLQLLTQLLQRLQAMSPDQSPPSGRINNFLRKMIYIPGASWVILACAGFWGGTFNEMVDLTGNHLEGAIVAAPSIYCLGVLLAFFGGNALQNSYDYLTAWKDDSVKIPMSFKIYPKTSVLLILISMYLSAFSYSAGAQLINDNFKGDLEFLRPYLHQLAETGLIFLGFTAMIGFFDDVLKKYAQYSGSGDNQTVANLYVALNQMQDSIQLMRSDQLLEALANAREGQLQSILNIKDDNDLEDFGMLLMQFAEQLKQKLFKKMELLNNGNDEVLNKFKQDLKNDSYYKVSTSDALLAYFDKKEVFQKCESVCQEYKSVCEIIEKLDNLNVMLKARELDTISSYSINDAVAGPSNETTSLIPRGGSIYANFYNPSRYGRYGSGEVRSSLSPLPFSNSNQMRV
ncbi:MAG: hypothetical protein RLY40_1248 [Pseudomonadota bacterium]|jgi:hypothetical protein